MVAVHINCLLIIKVVIYQTCVSLYFLWKDIHEVSLHGPAFAVFKGVTTWVVRTLPLTPSTS